MSVILYMDSCTGNLRKLCKEGHILIAVESVDHIFKQGRQVSTDILVCLLQRCIRNNDFVSGRQLYLIIVENKSQWDIELGCFIIRILTKCGSLNEAFQVFSSLHEHDVYTWTAIISACVHHNHFKQALLLYEQMQMSTAKPSSFTFVVVLKACACTLSLPHVTLIHADIIQQGLETDLYVGNTLVDTYAKCGSLTNAHDVFDKLLIQDAVSWNAMISAYAHQGYGWEALELFQKMQENGVEPNEITFVCILKACTGVVALNHGNLIHELISKHGLFEEDVFVGNGLIYMYSKCGSLADAHEVFNKLPIKNATSWSSLIVAYAEHGCGKKALQLLKEMQQKGIEPSKITYICTLKVCASMEALAEGMLIHAEIMKHRHQSDPYVGSTLIDMYGKCGSLESAFEVFLDLPVRVVVSWNALIAGYAQHGQAERALELYQEMQQEGTEPNEITFVTILKACASMSVLDWGRLIHADTNQEGMDSILSVGNTLVDMYAKCSSIKDARNVFDKLLGRDVISWNALLCGYVQEGQWQEALQLFNKMQQEGIEPDKVTYLCILRASTCIASLDRGMWLHFDIIQRGLEAVLSVGNTLIDMYVKCSSLKDAHNVFEKLPTRKLVSWSVLIGGYAEHGHSQEALQLLMKMELEGLVPDEITFVCLLKACGRIEAQDQGKLIHADIVKQGLESSTVIGTMLIDMYTKFSCLEDSHTIFDKLPERNVVTWCAIIAGHIDHGHDMEALPLFDLMQRDHVEPNKVTFGCILKACADMASLGQGKQIHATIMEWGLKLDLFVGNALIDMYAKCGSLDDACKLLVDLPSRDVVTWNVMMTGYANHGNCNRAQQCYERMQGEGIVPTNVTFVSLLTACSHAGLIQEGYHYFCAMIEDCNLTPTIQHYVCIIDLLGRAGCLDEAEKIVLEMPFQPHSSAWKSLLGSCAKVGNSELGRRAFDYLVTSDFRETAGYILMSKIYAANHMWDDAWTVQQMRGCEDSRFQLELECCQPYKLH